MEDDELRKVRKEIRFLTSIVQETLTVEMSKRGILTTNDLSSAEGDDETRTSLRPVIIRKYRDVPEAFIAKSVMESAGI
jgi:hypothetical protein